MAQMLAKPGSSGQKPILPQDYHDETSKLGAKPKGSPVDPKLPNAAVLPVDQQFKAFVRDNLLEHNLALDIDSKPAPTRLTHIVCTIGPASREVGTLVTLMKAGMNICRLNFSHGTYDYHKETVKNIQEAASKLPEGTVIATALDTKGPEIRTGLLEGGASAEVTLETGGTITVTTKDEFMENCSAQTLWLDYKNIVSALKVDSIIFIDDGLISLKVTGKTADSLTCQIVNGGKLGSKKGVNLPGTQVDLPAVSEKDKQDLLFGVDQHVDMVFASFIQDGAGIREIRQILGEKGKHIKILAKIESFAGIYNFMEILHECDGAMVARGDMGIEIPPEKVFIAQKLMISACNKAGKPVICATQMLESMTYKPRATRAESNDVANAVLDGADCVMLSGESAKGLYPLEAVSHMSDVCFEAEAVFSSLRMFRELKEATPVFIDSAQTVALSAVDASYQCMAAAILDVSDDTGRTAHLLSAYKPRCPVIFVTKNQSAARQALLYRAVVPHVVSGARSEVSARVQAAKELGVAKGFIRRNDSVVLVMGVGKDPGITNCIHVITV